MSVNINMTIEAKGNKVMPKGINLSKVGGSSTPSKKIPSTPTISTKKEDTATEENQDGDQEQEQETVKDGVNAAGEGEGKDKEVPKGKIACLLCRGFISYKSSDR